MDHEYKTTEFSRSLMAGVFAGIAAVFVSLIFNSYYRASSGFPLSQIINVSTIIFIVLTALTIAGLVYYLFHHYFRSGNILFIITSIVITALAVLLSLQVKRDPDPVLSSEFRTLLIGVVLISGLFASFLIPFLYKKDIV